eukprot:symbB.v1.2.027596.t1/scaffold2834.1/size69276/3
MACIATHGQTLFAISLKDGSISWRFAVGDVVYGSPFLMHTPNEDVLCMAARSGILFFLNTRGEEVCGTVELGGEVFSSPVAWLDETDETLRIADVVLDIQIPSESEETRLKLQLSFDGPDGPESQEVQITSATSDDAQLWRLQTVELLRELVGLKEGQLAEAREKVRSFVEMLSSAGGGAPSALLEDVQGQVAEAVSREDWYRSWGAHYLRSLSRAHLAQICNNFKDPGVQNYGGELFREVRDLADEIFLKLPPPNPAVRSNVEMLIAMGFPEDEAQRALDYAYNNVEQAATYLMEGMPTHRPAVRPRLAPTPASRVVDMSAYYDASGG